MNVAMLGAVDGRSRLSESLQAYRDVFRNPQLRRIELALVGSVTGDWAYAIALSVFAYEQGGTAAVGLVALLRFWPSAAAAPFLSILGDRYRRERVMVTCDLLRALAIGGAAATALLDGPPLLAIGLAVSVQLIATAFRPAQAALLPSLATRGQPVFDDPEPLGRDLIRAHSPVLLRLDQSTPFQHREVLHERRELHVERRRQLADGGWSDRQLLQDFPPRRVGQGVKDCVSGCGGLNHIPTPSQCSGSPIRRRESTRAEYFCKDLSIVPSWQHDSRAARRGPCVRR